MQQSEAAKKKYHTKDISGDLEMKKKSKDEKRKYKKERNTFLRQMKKYEPALAKDIIPITAWSKEENYGIMKDGSIADFMQILCKNLYNASDDELAYDNLKWEKLFMTYSADLKYIVLNFPVDVSSQFSYIKHIAKGTDNPVLFHMLEDEYDRLDYVQTKTTDRDYYLMFYAADYMQYLDRKAKIKGILNQGGMPLVAEIPYNKKVQVLYKLNNLNGSIFAGREGSK